MTKSNYSGATTKHLWSITNFALPKCTCDKMVLGIFSLTLFSIVQCDHEDHEERPSPGTSSIINKTLNNVETRTARTNRKHGWLSMRRRLNATKSKMSEEGVGAEVSYDSAKGTSSWIDVLQNVSDQREETVGGSIQSRKENN